MPGRKRIPEETKATIRAVKVAEHSLQEPNLIHHYV